MKILSVVFSLGIGGTERVAQNFAVAYKQLGHDSRVLCTRTDGLRKYDLNESGVDTYFLDQSCFVLLAAWEPDLIHIHSHLITNTDFKFIQSISSRALIIETNVFPEPSCWESSLAKSFQLSEWCNSLYRSRGGNPNISCVLPNPVNINQFKRAEPEAIKEFRSIRGFVDSDIVLGRIGQPNEAKWSGLSVKVFNKLCVDFENVKLLLVGPPDSILLHINQSPFRDRIFFQSQIAGDASLSVAYSSIDIFLHVAEIGESFGMVLAESLLCETPVVNLATPWADNSQGEVVGHGVGGFVAESPKSLYALCRKLILDKQLRLTLGRTGASSIVERYSDLNVARGAIKLSTSCALEPIANAVSTMAMHPAFIKFNLPTRLLLQIYPLRKYTRLTTGYSSFHSVLVRKVVRLLRSALQWLRCHAFW